jgi:hypothetical protein
MKRLALLALSVLVCSGVIALADDATKMGSAKNGDITCHGTITKIDKTAKMMTMKDAKGVESTCYWDDSTKVTGEAKEGAMATVKCEMKDGKMRAKELTVEAPKGKM